MNRLGGKGLGGNETSQDNLARRFWPQYCGNSGRKRGRPPEGRLAEIFPDVVIDLGSVPIDSREPVLFIAFDHWGRVLGVMPHWQLLPPRMKEVHRAAVLRAVHAVRARAGRVAGVGIERAFELLAGTGFMETDPIRRGSPHA